MRFRSMIFGLLAVAACMAFTPGRAEPAQAARSAMLVGYGLVTGLSGTGDDLQSAPFTAQSLKILLARDHAPSQDLSAFDRRVAAVLVTASLRLAPGDKAPVDLRLSAIGNATSLEGGKLALTSLLGPDGKVYVVGEGALAPCADFEARAGGDPRFDARLSGCVMGGGVRSPPS